MTTILPCQADNTIASTAGKDDALSIMERQVLDIEYIPQQTHNHVFPMFSDEECLMTQPASASSRIHSSHDVCDSPTDRL